MPTAATGRTTGMMGTGKGMEGDDIGNLGWGADCRDEVECLSSDLVVILVVNAARMYSSQTVIVKRCCIEWHKPRRESLVSCCQAETTIFRQTDSKDHFRPDRRCYPCRCACTKGVIKPRYFSLSPAHRERSDHGVADRGLLSSGEHSNRLHNTTRSTTCGFICSSVPNHEILTPL